MEENIFIIITTIIISELQLSLTKTGIVKFTTLAVIIMHGKQSTKVKMYKKGIIDPSNTRFQFPAVMVKSHAWEAVHKSYVKKSNCLPVNKYYME
jgi:hypothetical protein